VRNLPVVVKFLIGIIALPLTFVAVTAVGVFAVQLLLTTGPVLIAIVTGGLGWWAARWATEYRSNPFSQVIGAMTLGLVPHALLLYDVNSAAFAGERPYVPASVIGAYEDFVWKVSVFLETWFGSTYVFFAAVVLLCLAILTRSTALIARFKQARTALGYVTSFIVGATAFVTVGHVTVVHWNPDFAYRLNAALRTHAQHEIEKQLWEEVQRPSPLHQNVAQAVRARLAEFDRIPPIAKLSIEREKDGYISASYLEARQAAKHAVDTAPSGLPVGGASSPAPATEAKTIVPNEVRQAEADIRREEEALKEVRATGAEAIVHELMGLAGVEFAASLVQGAVEGLSDAIVDLVGDRLPPWERSVAQWDVRLRSSLTANIAGLFGRIDLTRGETPIDTARPLFWGRVASRVSEKTHSSGPTIESRIEPRIEPKGR
jgi:hypothetical protein